ncbi:hypothetical protein [Pararhizobium sp. O133]|uniref:hypothetical protein n=1 Tax=Pararhizobium sp. O133 TaxID=3449278 RepID=UPI003F685E72
MIDTIKFNGDFRQAGTSASRKADARRNNPQMLLAYLPSGMHSSDTRSTKIENNNEKRRKAIKHKGTGE